MRALSLYPVAWGALAVLLAVSFWFDFANVQAGGSIDLRNRVTGSRLLFAHRDPYFYKWQEPEPPEFCDPHNNPHLPVSKTTATPTLLALNLPLAALPYRTSQFVWLALQWLMLLGTGWLWLRWLRPGGARLLFASFVAGFTYTNVWRLHAERGQAYVLLLFVLAAWLTLSLRSAGSRGSTFMAGVLAGFLAALRPPFLLLAPFLVLHRRAQLPGAAFGLVLAVVLPMIWKGDAWLKYGAAMTANSEIYRSGPEPRPGPQSFPREIEGMSTDLLAGFAAIPYADFSFHGLLTSWDLEPCPDWPPLLIIGLLYLGWLWWSRKESWEHLLLGLAIWYFVADLFLPAYRNAYNDVVVVNIVALGLMISPRPTPGIWACFLALPTGWAIMYFLPEDVRVIDLPSLLFTLGAISLVLVWKRPA